MLNMLITERRPFDFFSKVSLIQPKIELPTSLSTLVDFQKWGKDLKVAEEEKTFVETQTIHFVVQASPPRLIHLLISSGVPLSHLKRKVEYNQSICLSRFSVLSLYFKYIYLNREEKNLI